METPIFDIIHDIIHRIDFPIIKIFGEFLGAPCRDKPKLYPFPRGDFQSRSPCWDGQAALLECRKSLKARENPDLQEMPRKRKTTEIRILTWLNPWKNRFRCYPQQLETFCVFAIVFHPPWFVNDILLEMGSFNCRWKLGNAGLRSFSRRRTSLRNLETMVLCSCVSWFMMVYAKAPIVSIFHYHLMISLFSPALKPKRLMVPGSPHLCSSIQVGIPSMAGAEKPSTPVRLGKGCPVDRPRDALTSSCSFAWCLPICPLYVYITGFWYLRKPTFDSPSNWCRKRMCSERTRVSGTFSFNGR